MSVEPTELVPEPASGRVFERALRPGAADADGGGRARLDAIARWLQDVAYLDLVDAGFEDRGAWIVRRLRIRAERFPRFGEELTLRTFCSGLGRFSAERRTSVVGTEARVEAVALWVCLDREAGRPLRFPRDFVAAYEESAAGRPAGTRLRHPDPPDGAERVATWLFRATDVDAAGHVNNSHFWEPLEQELAAGEVPETLDAEVEHRDPAQPGEVAIVRAGHMSWVATADGALHASILRS
ncbi:MAG TPA: acyl-ACP thioesterase domain-containing protein [Solirubrobacterales bacterium]|nr:acyl-ACP thioesterase domain-containing protein [Solirubrobacterales bacterium]